MNKLEKQGNPDGGKPRKPLRLWPGIVLLACMLLVKYLLPELITSSVAMMYKVFGSFLVGLGIFIWWAFFSRAPGIERWLAFVLVIAAMAGTTFLLDESIATSYMGMMYLFYSFPVICLVFVLWAIATGNLTNRIRRVTMVIVIFLSAGFWIFLRTDGMTGDGKHDLNWRWAYSHEDRLLERSAHESGTNTAAPGPATGAEWPGFRGVDRDGTIHGLKIATDWTASPPVMLWRRPVGPGCSSCAIRGNLLYTQEQRGEYETVSCYDLFTGEPVWQHRDSIRFYDSHAGAGPRSTPTLAGNSVYTLGATGVLNALDNRDGSLKWSRNAASDAGVTVLTWGFTSSPLVADNRVIVALSGKLAAYDTTGGNLVWLGPDGGASYSSPHLLTVAGVAQVLLMSAAGAVSVDPGSGSILWEYKWPVDSRILQPAIVGNDDLLLSCEMQGIRRVSLSKGEGGTKITDKWTSPFAVFFNDHVIHKEFVYGYDGGNLICFDLRDGGLRWKQSRYRGFILLLADQDILLILHEKGDLTLVSATPEKFTELARIPAITGKTWNHPALAGNILVVRNAQEMAAFRLPSSYVSGAGMPGIFYRILPDKPW